MSAGGSRILRRVTPQRQPCRCTAQPSCSAWRRILGDPMDEHALADAGLAEDDPSAFVDARQPAGQRDVGEVA